jgi:predicted CoA-binding protein
MRAMNPPDAELKAMLEAARTIAVVGASSKPERPSYGVFARLQRAGYRVIPVNPFETEVHGERAVPTLADVTVPIDIVDVFRRAEETPAVAEDAVRARAKVLWLQLGIVNERAAEIARAGGLSVVMDSCLAVVVGRLRVQVARAPGGG